MEENIHGGSRAGTRFKRRNGRRAMLVIRMVLLLKIGSCWPKHDVVGARNLVLVLGPQEEEEEEERNGDW